MTPMPKRLKEKIEELLPVNVAEDATCKSKWLAGAKLMYDLLAPLIESDGEALKFYANCKIVGLKTQKTTDEAALEALVKGISVNYTEWQNNKARQALAKRREILGDD